MPKRKKVRRRCQRRGEPLQIATMLEEPQSQSQPQPEEARPHPQQPPEGGREGIRQEEELQVRAASPTPVPDVTMPDLPALNSPPTTRKPPGKRKKSFTEKQRAAVQQKLALLVENFHPIPFSPKETQETLDLSNHEQLFRALGLWDFANLDLDWEIRSDLLVLLIANYDPPNRRSYVHDVRISMGRSDLARALNLPVKREKANGLESGDALLELFSKDESTAAIKNFMSNNMLFEDDMCILPQEVVTATQLVKEGQPHKVDWAGLMWVLVDKELLEAPKSGTCHYASYLQCLMKHQKPRLFEEKTEPDPVPEQESSGEVSIQEEDDLDDDGQTRIPTLEDSRDVGPEKQGPRLSLGLGGNGDLMDDLEECKEDADEQWVAEKNERFEHCLQRCYLNDMKGMEFENMCKPQQEGKEEERYGDDFSAKFCNLERLNSPDLLQAMDTTNVSYSPQMNSLDPSSGDFLSTRTDAHKDLTLDNGPGGSIFYGDNCKRHIGDIDDEEGMHRFPQNNQQKRMRNGELWEQTPSDFERYMEQIQCSMGKAKMMYAEKVEACMSAHLQLQYLNDVIEEKDHIIQSMEKTRLEEQQKWQQGVCQYEHELSVTAHLMLGYKKALRETRSQFAEYRKKHSWSEEPLYRDVGGTGGVVLSCREFERQKLEKQEEMRRIVAEMVDDFQRGWLTNFDKYATRILMMKTRAVELDGEFRLLKARFVESKSSDT